MRNLRRWPRLALAFIYLSIVAAIIVLIFSEFVSSDISALSNNSRGGTVFGLSLVVENPQTFLSNQEASGNTDWSTSFLLQSQSPITRVFLDYISVYNKTPDARYCFTSFRMSKDPGVPYQIIYSLDNTTDIGRLEGQDKEPSQYTFSLFEPLCIERGQQYFLPHIFLGIVRSETSADILLEEIVGRRAFEFFPFEKQVMNFELSAHYIINDREFRRGLERGLQPGWKSNRYNQLEQFRETLGCRVGAIIDDVDGSHGISEWGRVQPGRETDCYCQ